SRTWIPSFSRDPKAMYSASAQSTVRFRTISPRPFKIRLRPDSTTTPCQFISRFCSGKATFSLCKIQTSMDGEVLHGDGGGHLTDVVQVLL
ncbi:hypothetical protein XENOCAPTIV_001885, partial [Xenoophorus captivus]